MSESLSAAWKVQTTVWGALIRREIYTAYTKSRLGFAMGLIDPTIMILSFYGTRLLFGGPQIAEGMPVLVICITGYLTHFCMRHTALDVSHDIRVKSTLHLFPRITYTDNVVACVGLDWFAYFLVLFIITGGAVFLGNIRPPEDWATVFWSFYLSLWGGIAVGMITGVIERYFPAAEYLVTGVLRLLMYISGGMYTANELPAQLLYYLRWNPCLHVSEIARQGWSLAYHSRSASESYVIFCWTMLTIVAFALERYSRNVRVS